MTPWDDIAREKLARVMGPSSGEAARLRLLGELGLVQLDSVDDLYRFGQALTEVGGFTGAVGSLLSLHAVIHGAKGRAPSRAPGEDRE